MLIIMKVGCLSRWINHSMKKLMRFSKETLEFFLTVYGTLHINSSLCCGVGAAALPIRGKTNFFWTQLIAENG